MTDFGIDLATLADGDLDPMFGFASGPALVAVDVARRLQTEALFYAEVEDYGFDLRRLVAARVAPETLAARAEEEVLRDERVLDAAATVDGGRVTLSGVTARGPFRFVLDASLVPARLPEPA